MMSASVGYLVIDSNNPSADLRSALSMSVRDRPFDTGFNGPLMARRPGPTCADLGGCSFPSFRQPPSLGPLAAASRLR